MLCLNAILRRTVNICHLRIYILCYYLLGLGLLAAKPRGEAFSADTHFQRGGGSRGNDGAAQQRVSRECPI